MAAFLFPCALAASAMAGWHPACGPFDQQHASAVTCTRVRATCSTAVSCVSRCFFPSSDSAALLSLPVQSATARTKPILSVRQTFAGLFLKQKLAGAEHDGLRVQPLRQRLRSGGRARRQRTFTSTAGGDFCPRRGAPGGLCCRRSAAAVALTVTNSSNAARGRTPGNQQHNVSCISSMM